MIVQRLDALLIALAFVGIGAAGGIVVVGVIQDPQVVIEETTLPAPPPSTVIRTVERTVEVERASRSQTRTAPRRPAPAPRGAAQRYAATRVSGAAFSCLVRLWERESSWRSTALGPVNPNGKRPGGIPQILGMDPATPWKRQIDRGLSYIGHRYGGSPCRALAHSDAKGWY